MTRTSAVQHAYIGDIVKFDRTPDGDLLVYGKGAGPDRDLDGQRCHPDWLRRAVPGWFEWGNVREQHSSIAAGVGLELDEKGDDWHIKALVTDPGTAHKVETGTLKGWSLGAINVRTFKDAQGQEWIVDGDIVEFSLVDRPCNPTTTLGVAAKSAGGEWEPVPAAGEVIASVTKAVQLDRPKGAAGSQKTATIDVPAFDRSLALQVAATGLKKNRAAALKLVEPLAAKAVTADGVQDEAPDIAGGREVLRLLAGLIGSEADELAAGYLDESCDISLLVQAVDCVKWWLRREEAADEGPGGDVEVVYAMLDATPDTVKTAPAEPAEEFVAKAVEPEAAKAATQTPALDADAVREIAKTAAAEATKVAQAEIASLRDELAQVRSTAIPGGPFVVAPPAVQQNDTATKAADYWKIARSSPDPSVRQAYRALAEQTEADAHR